MTYNLAASENQSPLVRLKLSVLLRPLGSSVSLWARQQQLFTRTASQSRREGKLIPIVVGRLESPQHSPLRRAPAVLHLRTVSRASGHTGRSWDPS